MGCTVVQLCKAQDLAEFPAVAKLAVSAAAPNVARGFSNCKRFTDGPNQLLRAVLFMVLESLTGSDQLVSPAKS